MTVKLAIFGANGRMGQALLQMHNKIPDVVVSLGVVRADHELVGQDASRIIGGNQLDIELVGGLEGLESNIDLFDVIVDFSNPIIACEISNWCTQHHKLLVTGTTGFNDKQQQLLYNNARKLPLVHSPNMSPAVNLSFNLLSQVAKILGDTADVEIYEAHHKHKVDAPSGTAIRMGESIANAWGDTLNNRAVFTREGQVGPRKDGSIGFSVVRAGDIIGDHTVIFATDGERLEISHKSTSRAHYARGSFLAAQWLVEQNKNAVKGYFTMADVLSLDSAKNE